LAVLLFTGSFVVSLLLTEAARRAALRVGFVSRPKRERFSRRVVPLGGGVAIFGTLVLFLAGAVVAVTYLAGHGGGGWLGEQVTVHFAGFLSRRGQLLVVIGLAAVLFALGLWDDRRGLGPFVKLAVEFGVALTAAAAAEIRAELFIENPVVTSVLSALWVVLIINAFNFLDNMDGLSAGIGVIASMILFVTAASGGQVFVGAMALLLAGALSGFLVHNFPPARIFMGDAGSLVIGFFVAVLTLRTTYYNQAASGRWYSVLLPVIAMAVPLYDFVSVTLLRLAQGKSPFVGDTQHFSHRMKRRGLSDRQTVLVLYLATLCTGVGAIFLRQVDLAGAILIFAQTFMILCLVAVFESTGKHATNDS